MFKPYKRMVALLLAVMVFAVTPLVASAEKEAPGSDMEAAMPIAPAESAGAAQPDSSAGSMETALIAAKNLLKIDDDVFTNFEYSSGYSNYSAMEGLIWSFLWSDNQNAQIYAAVQEDGTVLEYYKYVYQSSVFGFAGVSKETAVKIADEFIKKAKPDTYSYYKSPSDVYVSIHVNEYRLTYYAEVNGYAFSAAYASVSINKFTGEVTGYSTSNVNPQNYNHESVADLISESNAIAAYAEKIGLRLEYTSYINYEDGTIKVFPVYLLNSYNDRYISAKSGEVVEYVNDQEGNNAAMISRAAMASPEAAYDMAAGGTGASLTPAEIAAVEKVSTYLTSEQALQKLLEAMDLADLDISAFSQKYIGLNRDSYNRDRYYYNINIYRSYERETPAKDDDIMYLSGSVDAESGRVTDFSLNYYGTPTSAGDYTEKQATDAIETFLKKYAPEEFAKSKIEENSGGVASPYNYRGDYNISYNRYVNGIVFMNNGISISFNKYTGKITRYSLSWYDNVSFPSISNVLTPERALAAFVESSGSSINYITTGNGNTSLVYAFESGRYIDPFSGKTLDYNGEQMIDNAVTPDYSDVAGHWSESVVMRLLENGVYLWGGRFEPNKAMTELEFLQYLLLVEPSYYRAEPAMFFAQRGIDIEADPDKTLTRQEAARIIVEYLGYKKLAEQSERFVYPFTDSIKNEYKGYVTICYMLGIISGDNGKFNASSNITHAQAAVILQNLIIVKS